MRIWSMLQKKTTGKNGRDRRRSITTVAGLIKDGILTIESGEKRLNMSESELTSYLS